ncbi:MAG: hypothetical protein RL264_1925 [Bacteroidota bacterium]|jgi:hypothetical protein
MAHIDKKRNSAINPIKLRPVTKSIKNTATLTRNFSSRNQKHSQHKQEIIRTHAESFHERQYWKCVLQQQGWKSLRYNPELQHLCACIYGDFVFCSLKPADHDLIKYNVVSRTNQVNSDRSILLNRNNCTEN